MTPEQLNEIEARAEVATPGPWVASHRHVMCTNADDEVSGLGLEVEGPPQATGRGQFERSGDAVFIAHARTDVPALIARVRQLEGECDALHAIAREFCEIAKELRT